MTEPAACRNSRYGAIVCDQEGRRVYGSLHFVEASLKPGVVVRKEATIIYSAESPEED